MQRSFRDQAVPGETPFDGAGHTGACPRHCGAQHLQVAHSADRTTVYGLSGQINGISSAASIPTLRFRGMPTRMKSVNLYPPGP